MKTISFEITEEEELILLEELGDVSGWARGFVDGQVNRTWKKFCAHWSNVLLNDPDFNDPIPSNKAEFINLIKTRDDYVHHSEIGKNNLKLANENTGL